MKKPVYILIIALSSWGMTGCKKEAKLTPATKPEDVYGDPTLPQGSHPYDAEIQQLFEKYRTLFLYKYQHHDLYYNVSENVEGTYDTTSDLITKPGWFDVPANEQYIGMQLDLLKDVWLNYYPDSLLRKGLPQKVYMLDSLYFAALPYPYTAHGKPGDFINPDYIGDGYSGGDFIVATWGGARIMSITQADKYTLKARLNTAFLTFAHKLGAVRVGAAFSGVSDYSDLTWSNYQDLGVMYYVVGGGYYLATNAGVDWDKFVEAIVSNSYDVLTSSGNILSPDTDTRGMYRKKYDVIINYFKTTFGVDLQAIGNAGL